MVCFSYCQISRRHRRLSRLTRRCTNPISPWSCLRRFLYRRSQLQRSPVRHSNPFGDRWLFANYPRRSPFRPRNRVRRLLPRDFETRAVTHLVPPSSRLYAPKLFSGPREDVSSLGDTSNRHLSTFRRCTDLEVPRHSRRRSLLSSPRRRFSRTFLPSYPTSILVSP